MENLVIYLQKVFIALEAKYSAKSPKKNETPSESEETDSRPRFLVKPQTKFTPLNPRFEI